MARTICRSAVWVAMSVAALAAVDSSPPQQLRSVSINLNGPVFAPQKASELCWAATVANLFAFYGYPVSQERIVSEVYGIPANIRSGDYSNMARLLNRTWRDDRGRPFLSRLTAAFDIPNGINAITNDQIRDALGSNRPLVIGTTSHAMLAVGMTYVDIGGRVASVQGITVFDPWPGVGLRAAHPSEVTPAFSGGRLMFVAEARISSATNR